MDSRASSKSSRTGQGRSAWIFPLVITLWQTNIAKDYGPFIDGLPINNGDFL